MISKKNIKIIFEIFHNKNPNPSTELKYTNNFSLLLAIILSAQTTDKMVNKVLESIEEKIDSPENILLINDFEKKISSINFYKTKSRNILKTCEILIKNYNSVIPLDFNELIKLPGVGRKTANVFLGVVKEGHIGIGIDTHVKRTAKRIFNIDDSSLEKIEKDLIKIIPKKFFKNAHHWLVLHGRYICKSQKPECSKCFISDYCSYYNDKLKL